MDNIEYLEVVDEQETIERLAHGYKENIEQTIVTALYQFEEINTRLSEGDLKWSQFIKANFILANSHLLATLVSIGKDTDFMVEDDEEYLAELREGYAEKDEEALQVCMIKTLIRIDDAHEALKLGDLSWQPFLLEIREECRLNFKAMEEVAKAFQKEATSD